MLLHKAGYRERVFVKSYLAEHDSIHLWAQYLRSGRYDEHRDVAFIDAKPVKVSREGTASKAILTRHDLNDEDCSSSD